MANAKPLLDPESEIDFCSLPWNLNLPDKHKYLCLRTSNDWNAPSAGSGDGGDDDGGKPYYDPDTDTGALFDSVYSYSANPLQLTPATTSLNYGTTVWEGLKCYRTDATTVAAFRPDRNYERMKYGASQLCLPLPSKELWMRSIQLAIQENAHLVPPLGDGMKLYIRPILMGTGQQRTLPLL